MGRVIQNFDTLASDALRTDALSIAEAGYHAIAMAPAFESRVRFSDDTLHIDDASFPLAGRRIFYVGVGKCAIAAAQQVEKLLGDRLTAGIALDVSEMSEHGLTRITPCIGTHPLPSDTNEEATGRIMQLLNDLTEDDVVLVLISGGGSTLLCSHKQPMTCLDESFLFTALTDAGATIEELNTVRKHLSHARGGGLAAAASPAEVISLIVSDVPGNDMQFIASGPTVCDTSTVADAQAVLAHYKIATPKDVVLIETPKDDSCFARVTNILFLTNRHALDAMTAEATARGYHAHVIDDHMHGEAQTVGAHVAQALESAPAKSVLLYAGETTVTLGAHAGKGGRNQELALATLGALSEGELILPFASDGRDNTEHAGAIADMTTRAHAEAHGLSLEAYLSEHRSYDFYTTVGDALLTGYTGSNVSDLLIALKR